MAWGIAGGLLVALLLTWIWILRQKSGQEGLPLIQQQLSSLSEVLNGSVSQAAKSTSEEINRLNQRLDERLQETSRTLQGTQQSVGERLDRNTALFGQVQDRLGKLEEANRQIQSLGTEIARLQDILRVPKLRGNLGELFLEELLSQILPQTHYEMQYTFRSGEKVDALLHLPQGNHVSVDAKFPLENFQRMIGAETSEEEKKTFRKAFTTDFKKHVDAIAAKYILPEEGTLDFALMYIPAENIYYEVILNDSKFGSGQSINTYALSKRVIPVSPTSLYAYLQLIVLGLRGLRIEERAREIINFLSRLHTDLDKVRTEFQLVGKHLTNSLSAYERSEKRFEKVLDRVQQIEVSETKTVDAAEPSPRPKLSE